MQFIDSSDGYYIGTFQFEYVVGCNITVHLSLDADEDPNTKPCIIASIIATTYGLDNIFIHGIYSVESKQLDFTCAVMVRGTSKPIEIKANPDKSINIDSLDQEGLRQIRERTDQYLVSYLSN